MIKCMLSAKLISCKSVQQSGHVPAAPQMPSVALTHDLSCTSTTVSQQLVFPLFLTGNGPRITADWLQRATLSLDSPGQHPVWCTRTFLRPCKGLHSSNRCSLASYNALSFFSPLMNAPTPPPTPTSMLPTVTQLRSSHPARSNQKNN